MQRTKNRQPLPVHPRNHRLHCLLWILGIAKQKRWLALGRQMAVLLLHGRCVPQRMLSQSIGIYLEKIATNLRTLTAMMKNISSHSCWLITKVTRTLAETRLANIFAGLANVEHRPKCSKPFASVPRAFHISPRTSALPQMIWL